MSHVPTANAQPNGRGASWANSKSSRGGHVRNLIDGVRYKIADCQQEREDAFRMIHDAYTETGLMDPNPFGMRVAPYHLLPTTDVFVAYQGRELIYTMTLISDDEMGIPMEDLYGPEIATLREKTGVYFAEVSCLASRRRHLPKRQMFRVLIQLFAMTIQSARENGVERLVIACHPRHARFYRKFLGFRPLGEQPRDALMQDRLTVACEHDFALLDEQRYKAYDRVYAAKFKRWELYHQPMLKEDREYFAEITELCKGHIPLAVS